MNEFLDCYDGLKFRERFKIETTTIVSMLDLENLPQKKLGLLAVTKNRLIRWTPLRCSGSCLLDAEGTVTARLACTLVFCLSGDLCPGQPCSNGSFSVQKTTTEHLNRLRMDAYSIFRLDFGLNRTSFARCFRLNFRPFM